MRTVGIVGENVENMIRAFNRLPYGDINLIDGVAPSLGSASFGAPSFDAVIAQDANPALTHALESLDGGAFLILNSDKKEILPFLARKRGATRLITYGFNNKACVTASSTMNGVIQACVQRRFAALDGSMRQPGEFDFPFGGALSEMDADAVLGIAAACLVCGVL